jgi:dUTP pyrophosphatase
MKLKIKKLHPDAKIPSYANVGDAGLDLYSVEDLVLRSNHRVLVKTGISIELQKGNVFLIWDKSGVASKGIKTMGGVVDSTYRGEIKVVLINLSSEKYEIKKGQKIAQALVQKVETPKIEIVEKLGETERGEGAFGSSGLY